MKDGKVKQKGQEGGKQGLTEWKQTELPPLKYVLTQIK